MVILPYWTAGVLDCALLLEILRFRLECIPNCIFTKLYFIILMNTSKTTTFLFFRSEKEGCVFVCAFLGKTAA